MDNREDARTVLFGMANALASSKSKHITVKTIKQSVGKYLKKSIPQGDVIYENAQDIAAKCLELFPDELNDDVEIKKRIHEFTQLFPKLINVLPKFS